MALPSSATSSSNRNLPSSYNYPDAIRALNDQNVQADLSLACQKLATTTASLLSKFDSLATHFNRDSQGKPESLRPRYINLQREFQQLVMQTRSNANFISGRLKMFYTNVLPLVAREASGGPNRRLIDENFQVISSYMSISAENASMTRSLASKTLQFCSSLNAFHVDLIRASSQHVSDGHKELGNLSRKLSDLDTAVQQICTANGKLVAPDISYTVYSVYRIISSALRRPGRSKVCHKRVSLGRDTLPIGNLYEQLEQTHNQVAYAQYAFQSSPARVDPIVGEGATLISEILLTTEFMISLFLTIWSRLQSDCTEIFYWLKGKGDVSMAPPCVSVYVEQGKTLYSGIANALDVFVTTSDASFSVQLHSRK